MKIWKDTNKQFAGAIILIITLGALLRFYNLTLKMIWADEIASIVHGLGNSFADIPSNKIITLKELMQPLEINKKNGLLEVFKHGIFEDFVPPLYFMLLHLWIGIFKTPSVFVVRSLSACFSVLSVPAIYLLAKTLFTNSRSVWLWATLLITLSPYSIALAQEVRHYSISIVFVVLSMLVFFQITRQVIQNEPLSILKLFLLSGLNLLGIASHYFFVITMVAELFTLVTLLPQTKSAISKISIVALLNLLTVLVWVPIYFLNNSRDDLTAWAQMDVTKIEVLANIFLQLIVSSITMVALLPVESPHPLLVFCSGIIMLLTITSMIGLLVENSNRVDHKLHNLSLRFLQIYLLAGMFFLAAMSYLFKKDFLSSPRYHFVYFPAVIVLVGYLIAVSLPMNQPWLKFKKNTINKSLALYLFGSVLLASSLSVVHNMSFLKPFHVDLMAKTINDNALKNTVIVTANQNLFDTSHLMALGWYLVHHPEPYIIPKFFLDKSADAASRDGLIQNALKSTANSSLWLINYADDVNLLNCSLKKNDVSLLGSHYKHYYCRGLGQESKTQ
jgi:uncharacterized membrane protein